MIMSHRIETRKQPSNPDADLRGRDKVLLAEPLKGEIDHAALTREIIAKFPKILEALAE